MIRVITESEPKARRNHCCDACHWILSAGINGMGYSFAELRSIAKAKKNKWRITKGQRYLKQCNVQDGEIRTFKAIPEIHDICIKYDLYDC